MKNEEKIITKASTFVLDFSIKFKLKLILVYILGVFKRYFILLNLYKIT